MVATIELVQTQAAALLVYQDVLETEIGQAFLAVLTALQQQQNVLKAYGTWFRVLAAQATSWPDYLLHQLLCSDNPFTRQAQQYDLAQLPPALVAAAQQDLRSLQILYQCDGAQLSQWVHQASGIAPVYWPASATDAPGRNGKAARPAIWQTLQSSTDWSEAIAPLSLHYRQTGIGLFATYRAFRWQAGGLVGIEHPDPIHLQSLVGYDLAKTALIQNTEALLHGYPALHVLLYGSRGSGKSSLVKALLHRYGSQGLRLIEVTKADLSALPTITDSLRHRPQKFIIFVDDLSFEEDDEAFKALKVVLEGNLTARPQNMVVYATSNRRHLIREYFGDRPRPSDADEVHHWDTVQEKLSFSDRFGLTLTFEPADQETYLAIVRHLAHEAGLRLDPEDLDYQALQWATRHNGRSGRSARQFVDFQMGRLPLEG